MDKLFRLNQISEQVKALQDRINFSSTIIDEISKYSDLRFIPWLKDARPTNLAVSGISGDLAHVYRLLIRDYHKKVIEDSKVRLIELENSVTFKD